MDNNKIGKFILERRKEKGLTQQELGNKLFVTDKAVSKWERGLSLPDIAILEKLAEVLDVDVSEILRGKIGKKKIDIDKVLEEEKNKIKQNNKKKLFMISIPIILIIIILGLLVFKHIYLGYDLKKINYTHTYNSKDIELGVPKLSFMMKNNDRSYSYKNLRSASSLENEIKRYLKTLEYVNCNKTIYYYDTKYNFTIINYGVKDNFFYSTISYEIVDGDYCFIKKSEEYGEKLGYLKGIHNMNGYIRAEEEWENKLTVSFLDDVDMENRPYKFTAQMLVTYHTDKKKFRYDYQSVTLEESTGEFEIKDDKLYYYRKKINVKGDNITIPEVSTFKIKDGNLILIDNYLKDYHDGDIVLE